MVTPDLRINQWQHTLRHAPLQDILIWAKETFGDTIVIASSLGPEDMVILDAAHATGWTPHVICLDTGVLFPQTLALLDQACHLYDIHIELITPKQSLADQAEQYGPRLWETHPDVCCRLRKVEPLRERLAAASAWITGIRRSQSPTRQTAEVVEWDPIFSRIKVNPLAFWTHDAVWEYIHQRQVPYNPLHDQGYPSIGCMPCTQPSDGTSERSGRWSGFTKTECGLHR
ncbi:phosphoadenylyl-sulfate reductase [Sulfobacillus sp. hq2]|nr:phosphoadenylyl-sulfate reductase [Sulfobacillus sp. hq2]